MPDPERGKCQAQKADGTPCRGTARPSGFCTFHDPELAQKRAEARRAGGRSRSRGPAVLPDAEDLPAQTVAHVTAILGRTLNDVRQGKVDAKVANAIGYLSSVLLRSLQDGELEARLAALETRLSEGSVT